MKIGISWNSCPLDDGEQIRLMKENGFERTFFGAGQPFVTTLPAKLRAEGILCDNLHAPFKNLNTIWLPGEEGEDMLNQLLTSVGHCARNEIPVLVVHLSSGATPPMISDIGNARFARLMELAKAEGVTIAYENQRKLANISLMFEYYPEARFCWDVGHEECFTNGRRYMPLFGDKLAALHLHDNDCQNDLHMLPYDGKIDMTRAARQLAEVGYTGTVMLEVSKKKSPLYDGISADDYFRRAANAARRFAAEIEAQR